ncbi:MAG: hypothetical protein EOO42_20515 [Flavobacteriales bacterium]|nr:MAG: hypothetical protein EOO42_20515 [Flavobacteriales bacterium]
MGFLDYFFSSSSSDDNIQPQPEQKANKAPLIYPVIGNGGVNWLNDNSQTYITKVIVVRSRSPRDRTESVGWRLRR